MTKVYLLIISFFFITISLSQSDFGAWYMSFNNVNLGEKWQIQNDIQYRSFNAGTDMEQLMLRGGIGYNLSDKNNNLLLGYAFIRSGELGTEDQNLENHFNEHRIYQQFITKQSFGRFYFSHRYRLEERFLNDDFKVRFRYFLNLKVAITNKELVKNTFYFSMYNEIFINGQGTLYDRNRLYGAFGFQISDSFRVDLGTMVQIYQNGYRPQLQLGVFKTF
jgi:hypothetical protein